MSPLFQLYHPTSRLLWSAKIAAVEDGWETDEMGLWTVPGVRDGIHAVSSLSHPTVIYSTIRLLILLKPQMHIHIYLIDIFNPPAQ